MLCNRYAASQQKNYDESLHGLPVWERFYEPADLNPLPQALPLLVIFARLWFG
jgi:hypothetical protein